MPKISHKIKNGKVKVDTEKAPELVRKGYTITPDGVTQFSVNSSWATEELDDIIKLAKDNKKSKKALTVVGVGILIPWPKGMPRPHNKSRRKKR